MEPILSTPSATSSQPATPAPPDHCNVVVFPPLIPASCMLLGVLMTKLVPPSLAFSTVAVRSVGAIVLSIGAAGFAWMVVTMKRARTPIHTAKTPTTLVETGPFRHTRNPMYLFGAIAYVGIALLIVSPWSLALWPLVLIATHYGVVVPEEKYLARKFGDAYRAYTQRVPRWI